MFNKMIFTKVLIPRASLRVLSLPSFRTVTCLTNRAPFVLRPIDVARPLLHNQKYSTKTAPPPPPKNKKKFEILSKITRFSTFFAASVMVVGALGVSGLVIYLVFSELFLPSGETRTFNKALKVTEKSEVAQKVLNFPPGERLKAHGEVPGDKWVRNRPIQSSRKKGADGKDHMVIRFHVLSKAGKHATVTVEQINTSFWTSEFAYIALDVHNGKRVYVVEPKYTHKNYVSKKRGIGSGSGFLGLNWGPRKD